MNSGTILAYQNDIPPRFRKLDDGSVEMITPDENVAEQGNITQPIINKAKLVDDSNKTEAAANSDATMKSTRRKLAKTKLNNLKEIGNSTTTTGNNKTANVSEKPKQKRGILTTLLSRKKFYKIIINKLEKYK